MSSLALSNWIRALLASAIAVSSIIGSALAANAVTNPADNPAPITVQGDDGNTYHDGEDTLPGYDDEECTYIPGAYFDFAANRVRYADGQSIHWTEWDRASGYREWLANQNETTAPTDNTADATTTTNTDTKSGDKSSTTAAETTDVEAVPLAVASEVSTENITVTFGGQTANNPGRVVGLIILASLFGAGFLLLGANALRTRFQQGGNN